MQATRSGHRTLNDYVHTLLRDIALWSCIVCAVYLFVALISYSPQDGGWSTAGPTHDIVNLGGATGALCADVLFFLIGLGAYCLPVMMIWSALFLFRRSELAPEVRLFWFALHWFGFFGATLAGIIWISLIVQIPSDILSLPNGLGGGLGLWGAQLSNEHLGPTGAKLLMASLLMITVPLIVNRSPIILIDTLGEFTLLIIRGISLPIRWCLPDTNLSGPEHPPPTTPPSSSESKPDHSDRIGLSQSAPPVDPHMNRADLLLLLKQQSDESTATSSIVTMPTPGTVDPVVYLTTPAEPPPRPDSFRPPLNLLETPHHIELPYSGAQLESLSCDIEKRLADLGILAQVVAVRPGPVVTLFELDLASTSDITKITNLTRSIARSLSKLSVRVTELPPPHVQGASIGLEISNDQHSIVGLRNILTTPHFQDAESCLTMAFGTDIGGQPVTEDISRLPHVLIAGVAGSGKTMILHGIVLSLLYKATPEQLRFIFIDPQGQGLTKYAGIPHLLMPVATERTTIVPILRWCLAEMERRYHAMASLGVRSIASYNRLIQEGELNQETSHYQATSKTAPKIDHEPLPALVIIIDSLADIIQIHQPVIDLLDRLTQKAQSAGIHLLLTAQRASDHVVPSLKTNIPARIAFKTASRLDSRAILEQAGAEYLLASGDLLYLAPGTSVAKRIHSAFIDDQDIQRVIDYLRPLGPPHYLDPIADHPLSSQTDSAQLQALRFPLELKTVP
jgi:S-DNA-T family DNA segregation ATPase FtsK/SpoIIIE